MQHALLSVFLFFGALALGHADTRAADPARVVVVDFVVEGDNPLSAQQTRAVLETYLGAHASIEGLKAAADALSRRLGELGFPSRRAILPAQTLRDGVVTLQIVTFKVGAVSVQGNEHYSNENVLASVPALRPGVVPDGRELSRQIALANEHPTKSLQLELEEGAAPQAIDVTVKVQDERPYTFFAQFNNRGTDRTEHTRLTIGAQHSNLFDRDHVLTATFTTSPQDTSAVRQYGAHYRMPLYAYDAVFSVYFVDSDVDSGQVAGVFDVTDAGRFYGARYRYNLPPLDAYRHSMTIGVDDKLFENDLTFGGATLSTDVRSRPLSLTYDGSYRFERGNARFYVSYMKNLTVGSHNDLAAYRAQRFGASNDWDAVRFGGSFDHSVLGGWALRGRLDAQLSDEPLIAGEQFGIGGMTSVRGYEERQVAGDKGYAASLELWSPTLPYEVRALAFLDVGYVKKDLILPGETESENLSSVGLGGRWAWKRRISIAADLAFALQDVGRVKRGNADAHVEVVIRF